jgi:hypothetical protein
MRFLLTLQYKCCKVLLGWVCEVGSERCMILFFFAVGDETITKRGQNYLTDLVIPVTIGSESHVKDSKQVFLI